MVIAFVHAAFLTQHFTCVVFQAILFHVSAQSFPNILRSADAEYFVYFFFFTVTLSSFIRSEIFQRRWKRGNFAKRRAKTKRSAKDSIRWTRDGILYRLYIQWRHTSEVSRRLCFALKPSLILPSTLPYLFPLCPLV